MATPTDDARPDGAAPLRDDPTTTEERFDTLEQWCERMQDQLDAHGLVHERLERTAAATTHEVSASVHPEGTTSRPDDASASIPPAWAALGAMVDDATRAELAALAPEAETLLPALRRLAARSRLALNVYTAAQEANDAGDGAYEWLRTTTGAGRLHDALFELTNHLEEAEPCHSTDPVPAWVAAEEEEHAGLAPPAWLDVGAFVGKDTSAELHATAAWAEALEPAVRALAVRAYRVIKAHDAAFDAHDLPDDPHPVLGPYTGSERLRDALLALAGHVGAAGDGYPTKDPDWLAEERAR